MKGRQEREWQDYWFAVLDVHLAYSQVGSSGKKCLLDFCLKDRLQDW